MVDATSYYELEAEEYARKGVTLTPVGPVFCFLESPAFSFSYQTDEKPACVSPESRQHCSRGRLYPRWQRIVCINGCVQAACIRAALSSLRSSSFRVAHGSLS